MTDPLIADLAPNSFAYYAGGFTMETTEIDSTNVGNYIYNIYDGSSNDISALFTSSFSPSPVMGSPNTITLVSPSLSDGSTIYLQVLNTVTKVQSYTYSTLSDATNFTVTQVTDTSTIPTEITDLSITSKTASTITIHSTNLLSSNSNLVYYTDALGTAAKITIEPQNISNGSVTIANAGKGGGARDYDYPLSNLYIRTNGVINSNIISSVSSPQGGAITIVYIGSGQYSFMAFAGYTYSATEGQTTVSLDTTAGQVYTYTISDLATATTLTIVGTATDGSGNDLSGTETYTPGGGDGSGSSGGTYPNNNYNNMASLQWSIMYDAAADRTVTVTVAGETGSAITADYTINVAGVALSDYISYAGAYGATLINNVLTKTYPLVSFDVPALVANAATIEATFRDADALLLAAPNALVPTVAGLFKNNANEFGATGTQAFGGEYPIEAIVGVTFGALTCDGLTGIVSLSASNREGSAPVLLLENLLAAGKVSAETLKDGGGTGRPTFASGDSLSVLVRYTLSKTRTFEIDGSTGGTPFFALNGTTITDGNSASEESTLVKIVEWKFAQ